MKLADATAPQQQAITTTHQQVVVVAGPGSGKTATTVARITRLIALGTPPNEIVAITFTNAAANELKHRLGIELGYTGTLHSFALRMLKEYGEARGYGQRISIISPESAQELLESKAKTLGCKMKVDDLLKLKADPAQITSRLSLPQTVIASYYADLRESGIVDFDVLLKAFLEMIEEDDEACARIAARFSSIFVDEMQDSAGIDWDIYDTLPIARKFYVGDPDQAIYSFRGGRVEHLIRRTMSPKAQTIALEDNFRSHSEITTAAQRLIEHNADRYQKATISRKGPGGTTEVHAAANEGEESAIVIRRIQSIEAGRSIAVLCRTNAIAYEYRQQLKANGLPVAEVKRSTLPKDWPAARALIELLSNPDNNTLAKFYLNAKFTSQGQTQLLARRLIHEIEQDANFVFASINANHLHFSRNCNAAMALGHCATQGISAESRMLLAEIVNEIGADSTPLDLALAMNSLRDAKEKPPEHLIHVSTIHGAKGLEFDVVFLVGFEDEVIPGRARGKEVEEERRLAYVAITRARKTLVITHSATRKTSWGSISQNTPSRFIKEAGL